jgi:hypothetical protein
MLHLYRRLLSARRASPALQAGAFSWLDAPDGVLAYHRTATGAGDGAGAGAGRGGGGPSVDERIVAVNFTEENACLELPAGEWSLEVTTVRADGAPPGDAGFHPGATGPRPGGTGTRPDALSRSIELGADEAVILRAN